MSCPRWFPVTAHLGVLLHFLLAPSVAQQQPVTADQVVAKYLDAIGADRFPSITTFVERGELNKLLAGISLSAASSKERARNI